MQNDNGGRSTVGEGCGLAIGRFNLYMNMTYEPFLDRHVVNVVKTIIAVLRWKSNSPQTPDELTADKLKRYQVAIDESPGLSDDIKGLMGT